MTFSIVARDPANGDLGVAVASKFLAVGSVVPSARAGVGAVATQAWANVLYGPEGLDLMGAGLAAPDALTRLVSGDPDRASRQVGIVDADGRAATHTGEACLDWAGGRTVEGVAAQGNILTGPEVVDSMLATFVATSGSLPDRLIAAIAAADATGGDRRGRQSAALLVVRKDAGYGGRSDRWIDLRVDDHPAPIGELVRLRAIGRLLSERPAVTDLAPIDDALAAELCQRLAAMGWTPDRADPTASVMRGLARDVARIGTARPAPDAWTTEWDATLITWMEVANLEERVAAAGWIDPMVLEELRTASSTP